MSNVLDNREGFYTGYDFEAIIGNRRIGYTTLSQSSFPTGAGTSEVQRARPVRETSETFAYDAVSEDSSTDNKTSLTFWDSPQGIGDFNYDCVFQIPKYLERVADTKSTFDKGLTNRVYSSSISGDILILNMELQPAFQYISLTGSVGWHEYTTGGLFVGCQNAQIDQNPASPFKVGSRQEYCSVGDVISILGMKAHVVGTRSLNDSNITQTTGTILMSREITIEQEVSGSWLPIITDVFSPPDDYIFYPDTQTYQNPQGEIWLPDTKYFIQKLEFSDPLLTDLPVVVGGDVCSTDNETLAKVVSDSFSDYEFDYPGDGSPFIYRYHNDKFDIDINRFNDIFFDDTLGTPAFTDIGYSLGTSVLKFNLLKSMIDSYIVSGPRDESLTYVKFHWGWCEDGIDWDNSIGEISNTRITEWLSFLNANSEYDYALPCLEIVGDIDFTENLTFEVWDRGSGEYKTVAGVSDQGDVSGSNQELSFPTVFKSFNHYVQNSKTFINLSMDFWGKLIRFTYNTGTEDREINITAPNDQGPGISNIIVSNYNKCDLVLCAIEGKEGEDIRENFDDLTNFDGQTVTSVKQEAVAPPQIYYDDSSTGYEPEITVVEMLSGSYSKTVLTEGTHYIWDSISGKVYLDRTTLSGTYQSDIRIHYKGYVYDTRQVLYAEDLGQLPKTLKGIVDNGYVSMGGGASTGIALTLFATEPHESGDISELLFGVPSSDNIHIGFGVYENIDWSMPTSFDWARNYETIAWHQTVGSPYRVGTENDTEQEDFFMGNSSSWVGFMCRFPLTFLYPPERIHEDEIESAYINMSLTNGKEYKLTVSKVDYEQTNDVEISDDNVEVVVVGGWYVFENGEHKLTPSDELGSVGISSSLRKVNVSGVDHLRGTVDVTDIMKMLVKNRNNNYSKQFFLVCMPQDSSIDIFTVTDIANWEQLHQNHMEEFWASDYNWSDERGPANAGAIMRMLEFTGMSFSSLMIRINYDNLKTADWYASGSGISDAPDLGFKF